ncbi:MAG TPA: DUF6515 family protein [Rhodocyclaceae bacterium]|nr:DUF6515 family protein [Rhodocyclaceae bacterium]
MSLSKRHSRLRLLALTLSLTLPASLLGYSSLAQADWHHGGEHFDHGHFDHGWHGGFRPGIGVSINVLPHDHRVFVHGRDHFFFSGGVWYRPYGSRFVVIAPPFGVVIPFLPDCYETRVIGGNTYYVADGTYYTVSPAGDGYVVTSPPDGDATTAYANADDKIFIYPRNGQSQERQDKDRYECHSWAMDQSGFDPTAAHGGVDAGQVNTKGADYRRAMSACLDGRGYTVK